MAQRARKRIYNLRGKRQTEDKDISKESTPVEQMIPRAHSTPKEPEIIVLSGSESHSESDGDDEYDFCCTQDTLQVQWDYSNTPKGKDRSRFLKPRRIRKPNPSKRQQEFSPLDPAKFRKRFFEEKSEPKPELTEIIASFQTLADKVKEQAKTGGQKNSETNSTSTVKHNLHDDIQSLQRSRIVRKQLLSSSNPKPVLEEVIPGRVNENYTSLFDDDADDCMVRCSQEVEEKLHEPDPAACGVEQKNSSDSTVALPSDVVENIPQNYHYNTGRVKGKVDTDEDESVNVHLEKEDCHLSDTQVLKGSTVPHTARSSALITGAHHNVDESFTAFFEDGADDCMIRCSQEIEEELHKKEIDINLVNQFSDNNEFKNSHVAVNKETLKSNNKEKCDSSTGASVFDDSLDVLLQNFTEEDISKFNQGVSVKRNLNSGISNSTVHNFRSCHNKVQGVSVREESANCGVTVENRRERKQFYTTNLQSSRPTSQIQYIVPSVPCGIALNCNVPLENGRTNSGDLQKNLFSNSEEHSRNTVDDHLNIRKCNSLLKTSPQKCTPMEIERKRLEARKKLEMKKCSMKRIEN